jgi:hypothetical protein
VSGHVLVRGTILAATLLWAWAEVLKIRRPRQSDQARGLYTAGLALALAHVAAAFAFVYAWSHDAAIDGTAQQTAAVIGIRWGGGIFVNYLFLALWAGDAWHWWAVPDGHARRSRRRETLRLAFFLFMFINGTIVFAGPAARAVGIPATAAVVAAWLLAARRQPARV